MIVFGIHCNFLIVLPIRLKTCRSNVFSLYKAKCARLKNRARLYQHQASNLSRPVYARNHFLKLTQAYKKF